MSYSNGCQCKGNVDEEVCDLNSSEPVCKWVVSTRYTNHDVKPRSELETWSNYSF